MDYTMFMSVKYSNDVIFVTDIMIWTMSNFLTVIFVTYYSENIKNEVRNIFIKTFSQV